MRLGGTGPRRCWEKSSQGNHTRRSSRARRPSQGATSSQHQESSTAKSERISRELAGGSTTIRAPGGGCFYRSRPARGWHEESLPAGGKTHQRLTCRSRTCVLQLSGWEGDSINRAEAELPQYGPQEDLSRRVLGHRGTRQEESFREFRRQKRVIWKRNSPLIKLIEQWGWFDAEAYRMNN